MVDKKKNQPGGEDMNKTGGMYQPTLELPFPGNPRAELRAGR